MPPDCLRLTRKEFWLPVGLLHQRRVLWSYLFNALMSRLYFDRSSGRRRGGKVEHTGDLPDQVRADVLDLSRHLVRIVQCWICSFVRWILVVVGGIASWRSFCLRF